MTKKNLFKLSLASVAAATCTLVAGIGAWAATQNTLATGEDIHFVADKYVNATVKGYINDTLVFTKDFVDTDNDDDTQAADIQVVYANDANSEYWVADTTTASDIDRKLDVKFEVTNTSTHYELNAAIAGVTGVNEADKKLTIPTTTSYTELAKEIGTCEFVYSYWVSGLEDADFTGTWTLTLTAVKKA